ncbi:unnamed protein product [Bathycoccus prasinos]
MKQNDAKSSKCLPAPSSSLAVVAEKALKKKRLQKATPVVDALWSIAMLKRAQTVSPNQIQATNK